MVDLIRWYRRFRDQLEQISATVEDESRIDILETYFELELRVAASLSVGMMQEVGSRHWRWGGWGIVLAAGAIFYWSYLRTGENLHAAVAAIDAAAGIMLLYLNVKMWAMTRMAKWRIEQALSIIRSRQMEVVNGWE